METPIRSRIHVGCTVLASILAVSACSTGQPTTEPAPGSTVQIQADYVAYGTTEALAGDATLIVEGTAVATEPTVLTPRFKGDTPRENPLVGLSDEEMERAIEETEAVPATAITMRADVVYRGSVEPGEEFVVVQTGGVVDGVTYDVDGEADLSVGDEYLLFATDGFDGTYAILGGSAGAYVADATNAERFVATAPEIAPAPELTSTDVDSLAK